MALTVSFSALVPRRVGLRLERALVPRPQGGQVRFLNDAGD
jgi:hypothetical protein